MILAGSAGRKTAEPGSAARLAEIGQVAVAVFGVARPGALFDDDLDRLPLVLVQHVVDAADGRRAEAAAARLLSALPDNGDEQDRGDEPDHAAHRLLVAQRFDRIEARCLERWIHAEEDADRRREAE